MARPVEDRLYNTGIGHVKLRSVQTGLVTTQALVSRADMEDTIQHPLPAKIMINRKVWRHIHIRVHNRGSVYDALPPPYC